MGACLAFAHGGGDLCDDPDRLRPWPAAHFGRELNAMDQVGLNTTTYFRPHQLPLYSSTILWIRQPRHCRKVSLNLGALTRMEVDYSTILVGDSISMIESDSFSSRPYPRIQQLDCYTGA